MLLRHLGVGGVELAPAKATTMGAIDATMTGVGAGVPTHREVPVADASESTDVELVSACLQGREDAWARLIDRYQRLIYSIPIKYGFTREEATDIFQETCVELLSALPRLREPRALPKWLQQVTAHKCAHLREQHRRDAWSIDDDHQAIERVADTSLLSEQVLFEVQREQALRSAVLNLSPRCRRLIDMLFFETIPRPYGEIARELALACGSIGFIRGRCLKRLRTELQKSGFR